MIWDQRFAYDTILGRGQQEEGGANKDNNCVPTGMTDVCILVGGPDINPQTVTDRTYGSSFHGGEDFGPVADMTRQIAGEMGFALAPFDFSNPASTLAAVDEHALAGRLVQCIFHCDAGATILPYETGIYHNSEIAAHVGDQVVIYNNEHGQYVVVDEAFFAAATSGSNAGTLAVCQARIAGPETAPPTVQPDTDEDV